MGKSSGSLWLSLGIRTEEFSKGLKRAQKDMNGFQKFGSGLKSMFNPLTVGIGAIAGVGAAFGDAIQTIKGFDQAMADVSAITGATGDDLKAFRGSILKVADSTGKGGEEIAKAFQMVGSAQPELLKSADALGEVTKQAVILSQAGGMDVPAAAAALTKSMNQFGVGADKAAEFIDILSSSQQMGTATIGELADSMVKAGGTARAMGMNFEQSNVMLQLFAKGGVTGAEAGTQMAGVLSKLAKVSKKEFNPTQTDALQVIKNLKNAQLSYTDLIKMTDSEGAKWITTLINQADAIDSLDGKLNNVGAAYDQAATRTQTIDGLTEKLGNSWDNFIISLDGSSSVIGNVYKSLLGFFDDALTGVKNLDIIWKGTFSGLSEFTKEELDRTLAGGWSTEFGQNIEEITAQFDKIPFKKLQANSEKIGETWAKVLGDDQQEAMILFNRYVEQRTEKETKLAAASKVTADATDEETDAVKGLTEAQLKQIKASREAEKQRFNEIQSIEVKAKVSDPKALKGISEMAKKTLPQIQIPVTPKLQIDAGVEGEKNIESMKALGLKLGEALKSSLNAAMVDAAAGVGEAIGSGDVSNIGKALLNSFAGLLQNLGQMMITLGFAQQSLAESLKLGPLGAGLAIAGGIALIAIATAIKSKMSEGATAFADGGIVSGPTLGLVGEYQGARNNPEVISPLDKLQSMIQTDGGMGGEVRFRIEGTTLVGVLEKQHKSNKYSR
jgi:TP901 family phage tail tape measure protein